MKRALDAGGLNPGEGLSARGGSGTVRLERAMASGREVITALRIAGAAGRADPERWRGRSTPSIASSRRSTTARTGHPEALCGGRLPRYLRRADRELAMSDAGGGMVSWPDLRCVTAR
jgi:hypothetical protein